MLKIKPVLITDSHSRKWDWSFKSQIITRTNTIFKIFINYSIQIITCPDRANEKQNKPISFFKIRGITFYSFSQSSNWGFLAPFSRSMPNDSEQSHPVLPTTLEITYWPKWQRFSIFVHVLIWKQSRNFMWIAIIINNYWMLIKECFNTCDISCSKIMYAIIHVSFLPIFFAY